MSRLTPIPAVVKILLAVKWACSIGREVLFTAFKMRELFVHNFIILFRRGTGMWTLCNDLIRALVVGGHRVAVCVRCTNTSHVLLKRCHLARWPGRGESPVTSSSGGGDKGAPGGLAFRKLFRVCMCARRAEGRRSPSYISSSCLRQDSFVLPKA